MGLFEELQDLMVNYHFRPEKKLSQFFCINEALLYFLATNSKIEKNDVIIEIGPGTGFLTRILAAKAKEAGAKVIAIEKDESLAELLANELEADVSLGILKVISKNALEVNFEELKASKIVSLPPYHISSDLLLKITQTKGIKKAILVLDRGFVEKLLAFEGLSEYNALTVLINLNSKVEVLENNISNQSFFPSPNCQSSAVKLDFDVKNNSKEFNLFLREVFRHKNKDLGRSLKQAFPFLSKEFGWKEKPFLTKLKKLKNAKKKTYLLAPEEFLEVFMHFNLEAVK